MRKQRTDGGWNGGDDIGGTMTRRPMTGAAAVANERERESGMA